MKAESVDMCITSPPYDSLREYEGYSFAFEMTARSLRRIIKPGGVIVWIVGDATINGSETGTSFKQALYFKEIGLNLHDTMIWNKGTFSATGALKTRYAPVFEYMFIFTKGKINTFNPLKDRPNISYGKKMHGTIRQKDGSTKPMSSIGKKIPRLGQRHNIWLINSEKNNSKRFHPAMFPEELVADHIRSWSNPGDLIIDNFMGSGTTAKVARDHGRNYIGFEISKEYCNIAEKRLNQGVLF